MTIPLVHKAAVRNSCQWSFFPKPSPALCPCSPDLPRGCYNIPCRAARRKELHLPHEVPQAALRAPAPALLSQSCSCSPSASPPLTHTRANMPTVSLATVPKPCYSFFLRSWRNTNHKIQNPHEGVTLVWPSTHLSHLCQSEDLCTRKYFTKWFFSSLPVGKF